MTKLPSRSYTDRVLKRAYKNHNTAIQFLPYIPRSSNLYGEVLGKQYGEPVTVLGYLETDPTELRLQDLGWSKESVDIVLRVPFATLLEMGLATTEATTILSSDWRITIPHLPSIYQLSNYQFREPYVNGLPTFAWISGKVFTNGR